MHRSASFESVRGLADDLRDDQLPQQNLCAAPEVQSLHSSHARNRRLALHASHMAGSLLDRWVEAQVRTLHSWVERLLDQENWQPVRRE